MLPSLRNRLAIALCPTHIALAECERGWRPRYSNPEMFVCDSSAGGPGWRAPLAALRTWLEQAKPPSAEVDVVVSDCFARYALIPWSDEVQRPAERASFFRIHFETLFGDIAAGWEIRADRGAYGKPGMVCALDQTLIKELRELFSEYGLRLASLQPHFMRAFNRWRGRIGKDALFVVVESGQCVLASFQGGGWHSIRFVKLGPHSGEELAVLIEREILLQGLDDQTAIYLHALELNGVKHKMRDRNVTLLGASPSAAGQLAGISMVLGGGI